jgi:hypothetical protein
LATPEVRDERERQEQLMRREKRKRLEDKGWRFGTVYELLRLSVEEGASVEDRLQSVAGVGRRGRAKEPERRIRAPKRKE